MSSVHMPNASSLSLQFDQSHELHSDGEIDLSFFNQYLELRRSTFATQVHLRSVILHYPHNGADRQNPGSVFSWLPDSLS